VIGLMGGGADRGEVASSQPGSDVSPASAVEEVVVSMLSINTAS
jgi:hypothetical protein